jgi:hypothetical protein
MSHSSGGWAAWCSFRKGSFRLLLKNPHAGWRPVIARDVFENGDADCICHFESVSLNSAFDWASCSHTASTVNGEIGMPNVVLVCGEMNRTIGSIFPGTSFKKPMYFPPPVSTIDDISVPLKGGHTLFSFSHLTAAAASAQDLCLLTPPWKRSLWPNPLASARPAAQEPNRRRADAFICRLPVTFRPPR